MKRVLWFFVGVLTMLFLFISSTKEIFAATYTWDGGGLTELWSDCLNWSTNVCPTSTDSVIFNSTTIKNQLQGNCYAHSVDAHHILSALGYDELAKNIQGFIGNVDFAIDGAVIAPHLTGRFFVDKIVYKDTTVKDGFGHLNLTVLSLGENPSMEGSLILESALVQVHKINIDLTTSKVDFKGNAANPLLDIHGSSKVEDISIDMTINGSFQKPQLLFNSDPPMPEESGIPF